MIEDFNDFCLYMYVIVRAAKFEQETDGETIELLRNKQRVA